VQLLDEVIPPNRPLKKKWEYDESRDPYREHGNCGSDQEIWAALGMGQPGGSTRGGDDVLSL
jgi:hypothetical protein